MSHAPQSRLRFALLAALCAAVFTACGDEDAAGPESTLISDEVFVSTYVELRATALRHVSRVILDAERDSVLAEAGVTEEELLAFVEFHGSDVAYMRSVWDQVERQLDARRQRPEDGAKP